MTADAAPPCRNPLHLQTRQRRARLPRPRSALWTRLGEGGKELPCGSLEDRYGLSWQIG
jgi:hypothetical protein